MTWFQVLLICGTIMALGFGLESYLCTIVEKLGA